MQKFKERKENKRYPDKNKYNSPFPHSRINVNKIMCNTDITANKIRTNNKPESVTSINDIDYCNDNSSTKIKNFTYDNLKISQSNLVFGSMDQIYNSEPKLKDSILNVSPSLLHSFICMRGSQVKLKQLDGSITVGLFMSADPTFTQVAVDFTSIFEDISSLHANKKFDFTSNGNEIDNHLNIFNIADIEYMTVMNVNLKKYFKNNLNIKANLDNLSNFRVSSAHPSIEYGLENVKSKTENKIVGIGKSTKFEEWKGIIANKSFKTDYEISSSIKQTTNVLKFRVNNDLEKEKTPPFDNSQQEGTTTKDYVKMRELQPWDDDEEGDDNNGGTTNVSNRDSTSSWTFGSSSGGGGGTGDYSDKPWAEEGDDDLAKLPVVTSPQASNFKKTLQRGYKKINTPTSSSGRRKVSLPDDIYEMPPQTYEPSSLSTHRGSGSSYQQQQLPHAGWQVEDMFETNETKFGYKSTYTPALDEYTTKLKMEDTPEFREKEQLAERLAAEIESNVLYQKRIQLENDDDEKALETVSKSAEISDNQPKINLYKPKSGPSKRQFSLTKSSPAYKEDHLTGTPLLGTVSSKKINYSNKKPFGYTSLNNMTTQSNTNLPSVPYPKYGGPSNRIIIQTSNKIYTKDGNAVSISTESVSTVTDLRDKKVFTREQKTLLTSNQDNKINKARNYQASKGSMSLPLEGSTNFNIVNEPTAFKAHTDYVDWSSHTPVTPVTENIMQNIVVEDERAKPNKPSLSLDAESILKSSKLNPNAKAWTPTGFTPFLGGETTNDTKINHDHATIIKMADTEFSIPPSLTTHIPALRNVTPYEDRRHYSISDVQSSDYIEVPAIYDSTPGTLPQNYYYYQHPQSYVVPYNNNNYSTNQISSSVSSVIPATISDNYHGYNPIMTSTLQQMKPPNVGSNNFYYPLPATPQFLVSNNNQKIGALNHQLQQQQYYIILPNPATPTPSGSSYGNASAMLNNQAVSVQFNHQYTQATPVMVNPKVLQNNTYEPSFNITPKLQRPPSPFNHLQQPQQQQQQSSYINPFESNGKQVVQLMKTSDTSSNGLLPRETYLVAAQDQNLNLLNQLGKESSYEAFVTPYYNNSSIYYSSPNSSGSVVMTNSSNPFVSPYAVQSNAMVAPKFYILPNINPLGGNTGSSSFAPLNLNGFPLIAAAAAGGGASVSSTNLQNNTSYGIIIPMQQAQQIAANHNITAGMIPTQNTGYNSLTLLHNPPSNLLGGGPQSPYPSYPPPPLVQAPQPPPIHRLQNLQNLQLVGGSQHASSFSPPNQNTMPMTQSSILQSNAVVAAAAAGVSGPPNRIMMSHNHRFMATGTPLMATPVMTMYAANKQTFSHTVTSLVSTTTTTTSTSFTPAMAINRSLSYSGASAVAAAAVHGLSPNIPRAYHHSSSPPSPLCVPLPYVAPPPAHFPIATTNAPSSSTHYPNNSIYRNKITLPSNLLTPSSTAALPVAYQTHLISGRSVLPNTPQMSALSSSYQNTANSLYHQPPQGAGYSLKFTINNNNQPQQLSYPVYLAARNPLVSPPNQSNTVLSPLQNKPRFPIPYGGQPAIYQTLPTINQTHLHHPKSNIVINSSISKRHNQIAVKYNLDNLRSKKDFDNPRKPTKSAPPFPILTKTQSLIFGCETSDSSSSIPNVLNKIKTVTASSSSSDLVSSLTSSMKDLNIDRPIDKPTGKSKSIEVVPFFNVETVNTSSDYIFIDHEPSTIGKTSELDAKITISDKLP